MEAVINLKREPRLREEFEYAHVVNNTLLVDRRTRWGNPWRVGRDGSREEVIARYRVDLRRRIRAGEVTLEELAALDGCWLACDPEPCQAEPPMGSVQVERYSLPDMPVHCAMCALCDNRLRRSSAALRRGEVPLGAASGRPWLRPKFRQGSSLARLH